MNNYPVVDQMTDLLALITNPPPLPDIEDLLFDEEQERKAKLNQYKESHYD